MEKSEINRRRNGAISMTVGAPDEGRITHAISLTDTLLIVMEKAIYSTKLADDIDPDRTNIAIPNVQQRWASVGSASELVCRTLLTGKELLNEHYLRGGIDCQRGLQICMNVLQAILAVDADAGSLRTAEEAALWDTEGQRGSLRMPAIPDIQARAKGFVQHSEHCTQSIFSLCHLFYGTELDSAGKYFDGFAAVVTRAVGEQNDFAQFASNTARFCKFLRNVRHCVEHERSSQRLIVKDFALLPSGEIEPPTIEVIHPETPEPRMPLLKFMELARGNLLDISELLLAFLCSKHLNGSRTLPVEVAELPEEYSKVRKVRFGYVAQIGDRICIAS